ncbi:MAG: N-acetylneuraminate synthase [Desulfobacteraceae bacterium]|nr:MAG: N-acetylneuraminate synthase [Desulfobacteraceae bacterium]
MPRTLIIAEAGVNHNGSLQMAKRMIDVAVEAGADAVKFQTFKAEKMIGASAPKAPYQIITTGSGESQMEMVRRLELDESSHLVLYDSCLEKGIQFLSTPFDLESIDLLVRLGLSVIKIPSGEITNLPYLRRVGALRKKIIMSTGMSTLGEIEASLDVLTEFGTPLENITLLHCNTEYPTPFGDVNLRAMETIRRAFPGVAVGYSDHTEGIEVSIAAAALGATVIEKHFTLDRTLPGPDQKASLEPKELASMIKAIRNVEQAMGNGIKRPSPSEVKNKPIARKSIVAASDIEKGELLTESNITAKRPGTGISPMRWDEMIGRRANRSYRKDDLLET